MESGGHPMKPILLCILLAGCISALDIERKYDASARVKLAEAGQQALKRSRRHILKGEPIPELPLELRPAFDDLEIVLDDMLRRARIGQVELGIWEEPIVLWSAEDEMHVMKHAGLAFEEAVRRKASNERMTRWAKGIGAFVGGVAKGMMPWWIWYPLWGSVLIAIVATLGSVLVWLKARFYKKAARVGVKLLADAPPEVREKSKGTPLQRVFHWERDRAKRNGG